MKALETANGYCFLIDDSDYERVVSVKWGGSKDNHIRETSGERRWLTHFLMGRPPIGMIIDHADGNPLNNCRYNLRVCSHSENMRNRRKRKKTIGIYKGVSYVGYCKNRPWMARIRKKRIGFYRTREEAALAYNEVAVEMFGEFASLNEIDWSSEQYLNSILASDWKNILICRFIECK